MERSIETIWKEGFLKENALVAPKLNDLYNKKSIHLVDKFKRMYRINIIAIFAFGIILLPVTFVVRMQYMGIPMFLLFMGIASFGVKFKRKLDKIDNNLNSYQYLLSFDQWVKSMATFNSKISRILYPYVFISMILGFWFMNLGDQLFSEKLLEGIHYRFPDIYLINGIPVIGIVGFIIIMSLLAYFGGKIGQWDMNLVYGRIIKKLEILLTDMEELRS